jgi:hypothetical protein
VSRSFEAWESRQAQDGKQTQNVFNELHAPAFGDGPYRILERIPAMVSGGLSAKGQAELRVDCRPQ